MVRKFKATWTVEIEQDLKNFHGIDASDEISKYMKEQIEKELREKATKKLKDRLVQKTLENSNNLNINV